MNARIVRVTAGAAALLAAAATVTPPARGQTDVAAGIAAGYRAYVAAAKGGGDYAIDVETFAGTFPRPDGTGAPFRGKNMLVWHCQADGSWKILRDMWSSTER